MLLLAFLIVAYHDRIWRAVVSVATKVAPHAAPVLRGTGVLFIPDAATSMALEVRPLGLSPDGVERYLALVRFHDALGANVDLVRGGDVSIAARVVSCGTREAPQPLSVCASAVTTQWQTRLRFGGPAAIVSVARPASIALDAHASGGVSVRSVGTTIDARTPRSAAVAMPLGPFAIRIGWQSSDDGCARSIERDGTRIASVPAGTRSYDDATVAPGRSYHYRVEPCTADARQTQSAKGAASSGAESETPASPPLDAYVTTPAAIDDPPLAALRGVGMWLSFSASPYDLDSFETLDPHDVVARAAAAGITRLEIRVAYGPFSEVRPETKAFVDALLDAGAKAGVSIVAWTVPRSSDFDDLAMAAGFAKYRTANGARFAGLALDLERGSDYLGDGPSGYAALATYLARLRGALGARYPLIATVEDPALEHLTENDYPFAEVARSASVVQPMSYWRMLSRKAVTPSAVATALRASYSTIRRFDANDVPIDIGGQTSGEGPRGAPPPNEVRSAVATARSLGAFGITFFTWTGTTPAQLAAIASQTAR